MLARSPFTVCVIVHQFSNTREFQQVQTKMMKAAKAKILDINLEQ